jgi:hypothetical protein
MPAQDIVEVFRFFHEHCLLEDGEVRQTVAELSTQSDSISSHEVQAGLSKEVW